MIDLVGTATTTSTMIQYAGLGRSDGECGASGAEKLQTLLPIPTTTTVWSCGGEVYAVEDLTDSHKCILREQMKNKIFIQK